MNFEKFRDAMFALGVNYNREITDNHLKLYWAQFKDFSDEDFQVAVNDHMTDPEQGKFWPTVAHLMLSLCGCEMDVRVAAATAFDNNPRIDGCASFDASHETHQMRELRKKRFIESASRDWRHSTNQEKLHFAKTGTLPSAKLLGKQFQIEQRDYSRILEGGNPKETQL